jgi:uncharacterized membrane-anchored protein
MHFIKTTLLAVCVFAWATAPTRAANKSADPPELPGGGKIKWTKGPAKADIGSIAEMDLKEGYVFTDGDGARLLLESMGNLTSGSELGFLAPASLDWFAIFRFAEEGYVKDDDKDKLDADKLLKSLKAGTEEANKERKRRGFPSLTLTGWEQTPAYDLETHNLGWAIRGESEGTPIVNYNTRILGRKGVMSVNLVVAPDKLAATLPEFKTLLGNYNYKAGERYAEYRQGDKLAKYGLTALVLGGAAVGAAKLGLFAWLAVFIKKAWKLVVLAVVGVGAFVKRVLFGRDKARE